MSNIHMQLVFLFLLSITTIHCDSRRIQDQMYVSFDRVRYCVRRLNATHEIGCQSSMNGNSGHMYLIDNQTQLNSFLNDQNTIDSYSSFIIFLNLNLFNSDSVDRLLNKLDDKLNGMLLYLKSNSTRPSDFSTDDQCPNRREPFYFNQTVVNWNPKGNGLFFRSFPFPIMLIDEYDDYLRLTDFYHKFPPGSSLPACGLELKSFQNAAHSSKTCMRRNDISHGIMDSQESFCDPVGGLNIYSKLPQRTIIKPTTRPEKSIILILARTDSFQMFLKGQGDTGGVKEPATALISLFALAHLIGESQNEIIQQNKEIIFLTLDGDTLDYSASFRFMFDMIEGYFPNGDTNEQSIRVENIHSIIELQSLSMTEQISLFSYPPTLTNQTFIENIIQNNPNIRQMPTSSILPPASSQIFLRETSSSAFPAYILTSANENQLNNPYYHSFFDDLSTVNINKTELDYNSTTALSQWIKDFVDPLAQSIFESVTGTKKNLSIDLEIVNNLVYCVVKNLNCSLIHNITNQSVGDGFKAFADTAMPFSINTYPTSSSVTFPFVKWVLAYFLRDRSFDEKNLNETQCTDLRENDTLSLYTYVSGYPPSIKTGQIYSSYCVRSYMHFAQSMSPSFSIKNYDLSSTKYPAWTESRWSTVSLRLFVIPSRTREILTLLVGLLLFVISFFVLLFLRKFTRLSLLQPSSS